MHKSMRNVLPLICVLGLCACASTGMPAGPQVRCPEPPQVSPVLMQTPTYAETVHRILFESSESAAPTSQLSKPPSE